MGAERSADAGASLRHLRGRVAVAAQRPPGAQYPAFSTSN